MRIHTNIEEHQVWSAIRESGAPVSIRTLEEHGSRTHARALELRLEGSGGLTNSGYYGAGDFAGATWDEWGAALAAIFEADPTARMGGTAKHPVYANREDYHFQTGDRFRARIAEADVPSGHRPHNVRTHFPEDTHPRHSWKYEEGVGYRCTHKAGCSAARPDWRASNPHRGKAA